MSAEINFYDAPAAARPEGLPAPRLQLRWEDKAEEGYARICHYELVFPLREQDIRNGAKAGFAVIRLGRTRQGGLDPDWTVGLDNRIPFRDGVHAAWDSKALGGLPIIVLAPNGTWAEHTPRQIEEEGGRSSSPSTRGAA